jgi:hypothetical protein
MTKSVTKSKKKMTVTVTNAEIDAHPLLTADQRQLCKIFRDKAKDRRASFTMLDFAANCLRATGRDYAEALYAEALDVDEAVAADADHRRAAIFYAYEAIKNGPKIITETMEARGTLKDFELLVSHGAA